MEATICDICEHNDFDAVRMERFTEHLGERWYPVLTCVCRVCGHVFMNPRMTDSELAEFYAKQMRESFQVPRGEKIGLFKADMDFITTLLGPGNGKRVLEVGCYAGHMLKRLRDNGWAVEGLEPNLESSQRARKLFGIRVHTCMLEAFEIDDGEPFDLIVMGSVLEHVNSPTRALLKVNQLLKINGHLFVRVPNVEELTLDTVADVFVLEHPNMYSGNALRMLHQKTGMVEVARTVHERFRRHIISIARKETEAEIPQPFDVHNYHDRMMKQIEDYSTYIDTERRRVDQMLKPLYYPEPRRVAIYGAGTHTEFLLRYTNLYRANIVYLLDSNPEKWDMEFMGLQVRDPDTLDPSNVDAVIISSRAFQEEIYQRICHLEEQGVEVIRLYDLNSSRFPRG